MSERRAQYPYMTDAEYAEYVTKQKELWGTCPNDLDGLHEMKHTAILGRCYNRYACECGQSWDIDSSD